VAHRPVALVGATASGKSAVAMDVARLWDGVEIVSVDSMQVYRGMDIGTAKPAAAERAEVPHHLIDLLEPWEPFDVARFQAEVRRSLANISARHRRALLVGGTGLYHRAIIDELNIPGQFPDVRADLDADPDTAALHRRLVELDPVAASRMEATNRRRVLRALEVTIGSGGPFSASGPGLDTYAEGAITQVGLAVEPPILSTRIDHRVAAMIESGLVDEVRRLLATLAADGRAFSRTAAQALGYRELTAHLRGEVDLAAAIDHTVHRTRQFARRQRSWFRRDPRITWVDATAGPGAALPEVVVAVAQHWGPPIDDPA